MAYKIDGSVHWDGVFNEKKTIELLMKYKGSKEFKEYIAKGNEITAINHLGGTQGVADAIIELNNGKTIDVTIKNQKSGTWDYVNSSKHLDVFGNHHEIKHELQNIRQTYRKVINNDSDFKLYEVELREKIASIASNAIKNIDHMKLKELLLKKYSDDCEILAMNFVKKNTMLIVNKEHRYDYKLLRDNIEKEMRFVSSKNAKSSTKLWLGDVKTPFRIRAVLNNGVGALVGNSNSNKDSVFTIKLQNDEPEKILTDSTDSFTIEF